MGLFLNFRLGQCDYIYLVYIYNLFRNSCKFFFSFLETTSNYYEGDFLCLYISFKLYMNEIYKAKISKSLTKIESVNISVLNSNILRNFELHI